MRANVPTDNDASVVNPVEDKPQSAVTKESLELAKIGNSPQWKILSEYMDSRIEVYKNGLFGEDLSKQDTAIIGQRFLAAQSVIAEFQSLKDEIGKATTEVNETMTDGNDKTVE